MQKIHQNPSTNAFVIGYPINHSLSPILHKYWLDKYEIKASYKAIEVTPNDLSHFIKRVKKGEYIGGNITIPHKQDLLGLCDNLAEDARIIGAVNTIVTKQSKIYGSNSDWLGFLKNLDNLAPNWDKEAKQKNAIILGAGGASRAIIYALIQRKFANIHILNRDIQKAKNLAKEMTLHIGQTNKIIGHSLDEFNKIAPNTSLVVNTSSVGMNGTKFDSIAINNLPKRAIINDIVYTPLLTPLLKDAKDLGLKTVDGLGMLLHQAAPGFEKWFGVKPEVDEGLRAHILKTLGE